MKKFLCGILILTFLISSISTGVSVNAATKTTIEDKKLTIGVGKGIWEPTTISLDNKIDATYTFVSSNTKIVKVGKKNGDLTGIKAGTASITVTQIYKKKSTKIGTCKVTVIESAKVNNNVKDEWFTTLSENRTVELYLDSYFDCINTSAEYTVTSSNTDVAKITGKANKGNKYSLSLQSAGAGCTTLTVVQSYKGKTKTVGKVNIKVVDVYLDAGELVDKSFDILYDGYFAAYIKYPDGSKGCKLVSSDENVIKIDNSNSNETTGTTVYEFEFVGKGTATLTYYEGETIIGTRKITVTSVEATEAKYSEGTEIIQIEMPREGVFVNTSIDFDLLPGNANGKACTVEIADKSICAVEDISAYSGVIHVNLDVKKTGTTTIVVKNGESKEIYKGTLLVVEDTEE